MTPVFPDGDQTGIVFSNPKLLIMYPPERNLTPYKELGAGLLQMDGSSISTYFKTWNNGSDSQKRAGGLGTHGDLADKEENWL